MWFMEEPSQFSVGQTAQSLTCSIVEKPHTSLDDCLNMLLSYFKKGCLVEIGPHVRAQQVIYGMIREGSNSGKIARKSSKPTLYHWAQLVAAAASSRWSPSSCPVTPVAETMGSFSGPHINTTHSPHLTQHRPKGMNEEKNCDISLCSLTPFSVRFSKNNNFATLTLTDRFQFRRLD